jgi:hypothetical protein
VAETRGHSWYNGLQVGVRKQYAHRYSSTVAYTFSRSEDDTDGASFFPQDQRDYVADRGPGANDTRHRLSASLTVDLMWNLRLTTVVTGHSALPYNITTGRDDNHDGYVNDRPPGVGRNSARGTDFWQADARISKTLRLAARRVELLVEAFNLANRPNWLAYNGNLASGQSYGKPTSSSPPRQVQFGIRIEL